MGPAVDELAAPGGLGWPWALPGYLASPPATAASKSGHDRSLPSHQPLTPGCRGVAKHLAHPALRRAKEEQRCSQCKEGAARPAGDPRGGEGKTSLFVRCRSCACSPRWVFRLNGTGLLGRSERRASDASAKPRLGAPRDILGAVSSAARSGPHQVPVCSELGGSQPCAPAHGMSAAALSGMNTITAQGTEGSGYCPHSILVRPRLRLAGGFGTAGAESCEGRRQRKVEQLSGVRRLLWSGVGSAWGRGSVGGSPQRCWDGHPAWLLTEVR